MDETLTLVEKTAFLKSVDLLASVPTEALAQVAARAREVHCDAGDVIFQRGDPNRAVILVIEGVVELRHGRALVRVLKDGMAYGELFLHEDEPHEYSAVAVEHTHLLSVALADAWEAMLDFPEIGVGMVRAVALRNHELIQRLLELEDLLGRFHVTLQEAGIEAPGARGPELAPGVDMLKDPGPRPRAH